MGENKNRKKVDLLTSYVAQFTDFIWAKNNYLYSRNDYWTMTANSLSYEAYENKISSRGGIGSINVISTASIGVSPVLNLKAGVLNAGTGTASDPYRID